jgi:hypothetical protein
LVIVTSLWWLEAGVELGFAIWGAKLKKKNWPAKIKKKKRKRKLN